MWKEPRPFTCRLHLPLLSPREESRLRPAVEQFSWRLGYMNRGVLLITLLSIALQNQNYALDSPRNRSNPFITVLHCGKKCYESHKRKSRNRWYLRDNRRRLYVSTGEPIRIF